jgi:hypothetical protein
MYFLQLCQNMWHFSDYTVDLKMPFTMICASSKTLSHGPPIKL